MNNSRCASIIAGLLLGVALVASMSPSRRSQPNVIGYPSSNTSAGSESTIEGFSGNTVGGLKGTLYVVTSLEDSGPCTLRDYLNRKGPRIIRFGISGTIELKSYLQITEPFLTIDGSTAPDQGVAIKGSGLVVDADNVILRYLRVRTGPFQGFDAIQITGSNVVVDHCSVSWGDDGNVDIVGNATNITVQWSLISENIGPGSMLKSGSGQVTVHHCMFASEPGGRSPAISAGDMDFVNNIVYNWNSNGLQIGGASQLYQFPAGSTSRANFVGNYYKPGPNSVIGSLSEIRAYEGTLFLQGNIGPHRLSDKQSEADIADVMGASVVSDRFQWPKVTTTSADKVLEIVQQSAGAILPCRDSVDKRIVKELRTVKGRLISQSSQGIDWPDLKQPCP